MADQILKENCTSIGYIQKPHGLRGEVTAVIDDNYGSIPDSAEYLFLEIDGGLVPFYLSEDGLRYRSNDIIIKFDYIDNLSKAKEISGCKIWIENVHLNQKEQEYALNPFDGMEVFDLKRGKLGTVIKLDDYSGNIVITVAHPVSEILIPLSEEIIQKIDQKNKKIYLECPEGLIDIYLE